MSDETQKLDDLLSLYANSIKGKLWRGADTKQEAQKSINTGYELINQQLHRQGWPLGTVNEFGIKQHGIGELRLLMPALRALQKGVLQKESSQATSELRNIILIAPPYLPFSPALVKENIDLTSFTVVRTKTLKESLWAAEQSLIANSCAAVIFWTGTHKINNHDLRRLQLAAEKAHSWSVLFRDSRCLEQSSVSGLRVQLHCNSHNKLELHILKQPQGWGGQKCIISLAPHYENWQRLPTSLLPVHTTNQHQAIQKKHQSNALPPTEKHNVTQPKAWHTCVTIIAPLSALQTVH